MTMELCIQFRRPDIQVYRGTLEPEVDKVAENNYLDQIKKNGQPYIHQPGLQQSWLECGRDSLIGSSKRTKDSIGHSCWSCSDSLPF